MSTETFIRERQINANHAEAKRYNEEAWGYYGDYNYNWSPYENHIYYGSPMTEPWHKCNWCRK